MFLKFYGLTEKPFSQTPDPKFLYFNEGYRESIASLRYGIQERKGFITLIGEAGTGKTTLLRKLLDDLGPDVVSVFLFNPNASFEEILEYTLSELGISAQVGRKLVMLQRLNDFLLAGFAEGRNTILLIDEAQDLEPDVLESLRLLSNLESSKEKILQIVLSGQPELAIKLAQPNLRQLKQRIAVRCRLEPLGRDELTAYIKARLAVAGGREDLFSPETLDLIWDFSSGIPRLINTVCDNALLVGYALSKQKIDREVIDEVIADLRKLDVRPEDLPRDTGRVTGEPQASAEVSAPRDAESSGPPPPVSTPSPRAVAAAATVGSEGRETRQAAVAPQVPVEPPVPVEPAAQSSNSPSPAPASRPATRTTEVARRSGSSATRFVAAAVGVIALIGAVTVVARSSLRPILRGTTATESQTGGRAEPAAVQGTAPGAAQSEPSAANVASANDPVAEHASAAQAAPGEAPAEPDHGPSVAAAPPPIASQPAAAPGRELAAAEQAGAAQPAVNARPAPADSAPPPTTEIARKAAAPAQEANAVASVAAPVLAKDAPAERAASRAKAKTSARHDETAPPSEDAHKDPAPADDVALEPVGEDEEVESASATGVQDLQLSPSHLPGRGKRVLVRRGDTLMNLAAREYGSANFTTLDVVKAANPTVQDVNKIVAGTELTFPDPGPAARIVPRGKGLAVIVMTTPNQQRALATQRELRARYSSPVEIESVDLSDGRTLYRVSMGDYQETTQALKTAESLGNILSDRGL